MPRLTVLGRIDLCDDNGRDFRKVLAQPKRLALLAYLCLQPRAPIRRDTLVGVFWPELDQTHARKALNNALYFLRQELGDDIIVSQNSDAIVANADVISCDAVAFYALFKAGRFAEASTLYGGELLPGLFPLAGPEFESWVDGERERLRQTATQAAAKAAAVEEAGGNFPKAVSYARRALELSQHDESVLRELVELLVRLGDSAAALDAYDRFARVMASEFDSQPAPGTRALIERVRAQCEPVSTTPASLVVNGAVVPRRLDTFRRTKMRRRTALAATAASGLLVALSVWTGTHSSSWRRENLRHVVIADFEVSGVDLALVASAQHMIASVLNRSNVVRSIAPDQLLEARRAAMLPDTAALVNDRAHHVAYRTDAVALVEGRIDPVGDGSFNVIVRACDATTGDIILSADSVVGRDAIVPTAGTLATQLLIAFRAPADTQGAGIRYLRDGWPGGEVTPSFRAYKALLQSYDASRHANEPRMLSFLREALLLDTGFTAAWDWLAEHYQRLGLEDSARFALMHARERSARLSSTGKLVVEAHIARIDGDPARAVRLWRAAIQQSPEVGSLYVDLAYDLLMIGEYDEAIAEYRAANRMSTPEKTPSRRLALAFALFAVGKLHDANSLRQTVPPHMQRTVDWTASVIRGDWDDVARTAAELETGVTAQPEERASAAVRLASAQAARGQIAAALASIHRGTTYVRGRSELVDVYLLPLFLASELSAVSETTAIHASDATRRHPVTSGLWHARRGSYDAARRELELARSAVRSSSDPAGRDVELLDAFIASRSRRYRDVVDLLAGPAWRGAPGDLAGTTSSARRGLAGVSLNMRRWLVADAYERLGQLDSAVVFFDLITTATRIRFDEQRSNGFILPFAHRRLAKLYSELRDEERARHEWRAVVQMLTMPDAVGRVWVDEARSNLHLGGSQP